MAVGTKVGSGAPSSDQNANTIFAGAVTGADAAPGFRSLVTADLPTGIPNANLFNSGNNDLLALQELGSVIKGYPLGSAAIASINNTYTLSNGAARFSAVYLPKAATLTGIKFFIVTSGSYTSTGYNGIALYTINVGTGLLTQVAASTSSTTIWAGSLGLNSVNFSATYAATEGVYFAAMLSQWSAAVTVPIVYAGSFNANTLAYDFANSIKLNSFLVTGTLPATQASSGLTAAAQYPYLYLF